MKLKVHADLKLERSGEAAVVIGRSTAKLNEKSMVGKARDFFGLDDGKQFLKQCIQYAPKKNLKNFR